MEWNERLQEIIDYVECHLQQKEEPVNTEEIARMAGCSFSFFQKVFSYMNGISFSEYIRSRKLTLAGYDLKSTKMRVVDISYKYGYDSPTSFTKAFLQFHGITPKEARTGSAELKICPKMQIASKNQYLWRLEQKGPMRLLGKKARISHGKEGLQWEITRLWSEYQKNGVFARLFSLDTGEPRGMFGIFGSVDEDAGEMEYAIMVISAKETPPGMDEHILPEATWAIFDCRGAMPHGIQEGWKYLTGEWLIKYPFRHADCPELEWYSDGNPYDEEYLSQIWIPIINED